MKILIACDHSSHVEKIIQDLKRSGISKPVEAVVLSVADVIAPPMAVRGELGMETPYVAEHLIQAARLHAKQEVKKALMLASRIAKEIKKNFSSWKVKPEACTDSPAWAIIKKAEKWGADLIVIGSHDVTPLGQLIAGSVAHKVVHEAACSVRVLHGRSETPDITSRIVIGVDGSKDSAWAVEEAASRKWKKGSAVYLLSILDHQATLYAFSSASVQKKIEKADKDAKIFLSKVLDQASKKLKKAGLIVSTALREGNPKKVLVEEADKWGADTIFLGARGLRGIERFLIGSVSSSVAFRAHCTVEIVRH